MLKLVYDNLKYYGSNLLFKIGFWKMDARLVVLGLDNSGKTTLLNFLKTNRLKQLAPTNQPYSEEITIGKVIFTMHDLGGHSSVRRLWNDYIINIDCIIFIVDASDNERIEEATFELNKLLTNEYIANVVQ